MSDNKTERQLNLLFLLLNTAQPIEREAIRKRVPGYSGKSDEAFERMFERDKEDLRDLNIPIETVSIDVFQEDLFGYRIKREAWLLPELELSLAERSILSVAAAAWREAQLSSAFAVAAKRMGNSDSETSVANQIGLSIDLANTSAHLLTIMKAKRSAKCVTFSYLSSGSKTPKPRVVAPWRIFLSKGNSYLIGFDHDKGEARTFRLSRVVGNFEISDEDIIEEEPTDFSAAQVVASWRDNSEQPIKVRLAIKPGKLGSLRMLADLIEPRTDLDLIEFQATDLTDIARQIARNCADVQVIEPQLLKDKVREIIGGIKWL